MNINKELIEFLMKRGITFSAKEESIMMLVIEFIIEKIKEGKIKL